MEIIHIPQVFTLWTNRVETKGKQWCDGKLIALTRYNKSLLLPRWGLKLDTIPLWCFCGQKIHNHVPSLVKNLYYRKGTYFKKISVLFSFAEVWPLPHKTMWDRLSTCVLRPWMRPNHLWFPHYIHPLYLDYFGAEYTRTLICHSDLPQDGPDVIWLGPVLAKENLNCLNKFYRGKIIWMYRQYIEYHGMTRCEVNPRVNIKKIMTIKTKAIQDVQWSTNWIKTHKGQRVYDFRQAAKCQRRFNLEKQPPLNTSYSISAKRTKMM